MNSSLIVYAKYTSIGLDSWSTLDEVPLTYFQKIHDEVQRFEQAYAVNDNVSDTFDFAKRKGKRKNHDAIVEMVKQLTSVYSPFIFRDLKSSPHHFMY